MLDTYAKQTIIYELTYCHLSSEEVMSKWGLTRSELMEIENTILNAPIYGRRHLRYPRGSNKSYYITEIEAELLGDQFIVNSNTIRCLTGDMNMVRLTNPTFKELVDLLASVDYGTVFIRQIDAVAITRYLGGMSVADIRNYMGRYDYVRR